MAVPYATAQVQWSPRHRFGLRCWAARARRRAAGLPIRVLFVLFECSSTVTDEANLAGHIATSIDQQAACGYSRHLQMDANDFMHLLERGQIVTDAIFAFPCCTHLSPLARVHFGKVGHSRVDRAKALGLATRVWALPVHAVYIENPASSFLSTRHGPPNQVVHPWNFGSGPEDDYCKPTGFWMGKTTAPKQLHAVRHTKSSSTRSGRNFINKAKGNKEQVKYKRSKLPPGMAKAMVRDFL